MQILETPAIWHLTAQWVSFNPARDSVRSSPKMLLILEANESTWPCRLSEMKLELLPVRGETSLSGLQQRQQGGALLLRERAGQSLLCERSLYYLRIALYGKRQWGR